MFKFFKDKLKGALDSFSKKFEDSSEEVAEKAEVLKEEIPAVAETVKGAEKAEVREKEKDEKKVAEKEEKKEAVDKAKERRIAPEKEEIKEVQLDDEQLFEEQLKKTQQEHGLSIIEEPQEAKKESGLFSKIKGLFAKKEEEKPKEEVKSGEAIKKEEKPQEPEKKGLKELIAEKITKKVISGKQFDELFSDLEIVLLENNVAVEVMEKIREDMKKVLVDRPIPRNKIKETIIITLKSSIEQLFEQEKEDLLKRVKGKKPYVILFFGVNGSGKTTTIAKLAKLFKDANLSPVIAAADTFRAAAIQQLEEHAAKLNVPLIKKGYGADPAAIAFDAIRFAESNKSDVVLIDTAGRLQSNTNLMDEMRKMVRVSKPDMKIFVGESTTGNDCVEQANRFNEVLGIDAIILSKADVDEKGGAAISISYVTKKPIIYIGTGQKYEDLKPFKKELVVESLGL